MARLGGHFRTILSVIALVSCLTTASRAATAPVHTFDCKNCHISSLSVSQLGEGNVCLSCHDQTLNTPLSDNTIGATLSAFAVVDASNAFGNNPGTMAGKGQTSHNWGAPDTEPRAGATPPDPTLYPQFYSRFGSSNGKVTCSRCHNPHADRSNPQLLVMGAGSAQQMCLACHAPWDQGHGNSNITHPVDIDYAAAAAAHPGKYASPPPEDDHNLHENNQITLFDGKVLCGSCHQIHFADSDATTTDIPANFANLTMHGGDGKILHADGAGRADKAALCRTCHTYQAHGDGTGERVGCLICHGGHAYDPAAPNYFMLRKRATTTTYGAIEGLDYSSPSVLDSGLKYTFWNDRTDGTANGYCEKCHGDARTIGLGAGEYHLATAVCTDCHSHGQTSGAFTASCNACHGMPPVAGTSGGPDGLVGTPGPTGSATPGAHATHSTTKQYPCGSCHANSAGSGATHNAGTAQTITIGFSLFDDTYRGGTYNGQGSANYDSSQPDTTVTNNGLKTCANVYCHGSTMADNGGTNLSPAWDNPATGSCGKCHGATTATPPLRGSHRTHAGQDTWWHAPNTVSPFNNYIYSRRLACTVCHDNPATAHVDGAASWSFDTITLPWLSGAQYKGSSTGADTPVPGTYGQCANLYCHSIAQTSTGGPLTGLPGEYQTPTWGNLDEGTCGTCHFADGGHSFWADKGMSATEISSGSHTRHLLNLTATVGSGANGPSRCGVCHNYVGSDSLSGCASVCHNRDNLHVNNEIDVKFPPTAYGATAAYDGTATPGDGYGACAATYCHGNYPGSGRNATPTWGDAATAACGSCHGGSNSAPPDSGSHGIHAYSTGYNIACTACHSDTVAGTDPYTIASQQKHVNSKIDWAFDSSDARLRGGAEHYNIASATAPPSDGTTPRAYSTCANIYCHSNAQPDGGLGNPDSYASPTWGSSTGLGCGSCHQGGVHGDTGPLIASGSHAVHLALTLTSSGVNRCMVCHRYNTTLSGPGNNCQNCHPHTGPPYSSVLFEKHVDGKVTINIDPVYGSSGSYSGTPAPGDGYGTCSNVSCHGSGTPQWGGTVACGDCHALPPATGAHLAHTDGTGAAYGSDSNLSTPASQGFNCGNCHALAGSKHGNGVVEIELYNAAATGFKQNNPANAGRTGTGTATVCSNIYCHSSGQNADARSYAATPQWGGMFSGNRCGGCHGDPPAYFNGGAGSATANSHYGNPLSFDREGGHLIGLHFDNIKKDPPDPWGGLYPKAGGAETGAGHGDPATSTTISCPTCHAATVSVAGQKSAQGTAFDCASCHVNPVAGSIADKSWHVNGVRDVVFMTGTFRTRAQLNSDTFTAVIEPLGWTRNNGYKTVNSFDSVPFSGSYNAADKNCTTVCHLNQPITWGDTSKGCVACHADL